MENGRGLGMLLEDDMSVTRATIKLGISKATWDFLSALREI